MAYFLEFHETTVVPYLLNLPLSREARLILATFFQNVCAHADTYRNNPERRPAPSSKVLHNLRLILSDASAHYGVLRAVFAEDEPAPPE